MSGYGVNYWTGRKYTIDDRISVTRAQIRSVVGEIRDLAERAEESGDYSDYDDRKPDLLQEQVDLYVELVGLLDERSKA